MSSAAAEDLSEDVEAVLLVDEVPAPDEDEFPLEKPLLLLEEVPLPEEFPPLLEEEPLPLLEEEPLPVSDVVEDPGLS